MNKKIIGRKDIADFPDFGLQSIQVKIDSGAYSCSIDCRNVHLIEKAGKKLLEVVFLNSDRDEFTEEVFYFEDFKSKKVKSSTGHSQIRYFIKGRIILFEKEYNTYFSLSKRSGMKTPVLIGRKLLNNNFMIDTKKVNLSHNLKAK
jgi:hypothetical protein